MSESRVGVFTADNGKFSVSLNEDSDFNNTITEVHGNSNVGVVVVVDVLDLVGGPGSMDDVAVVSGIDSDGSVGIGSTSSAHDGGEGVDEVNTGAGILLIEVFARVDSIISGVVFPVDIRAHDGTTSQLFHQLGTAPLGFVGNAGKSGKAVDSFAGLGATTLVFQFGGRNGSSEQRQSRQQLSENHGFFVVFTRERRIVDLGGCWSSCLYSAGR